MKINLKNLVVETKSGVDLGSIKDIILDTENQAVWQYEVGGLFGKKYLISPEQVISIDDKKMLAEDSVSKFENQNIGESEINIEPEGVVMDQSV